MKLTCFKTTLLALFVSLFLGTGISAQSVISYDMFTNNLAYNLTAEVADSVTKEPVAFASVYLKHVKDTIITNFALTGPDGKIHMNDVTKGEYDFYVEFMGYKPYHKTIYVRKTIDLKKILLKPDVQAIKEAKVTAGVKNLGKERRSITVTGTYSYGNFNGDSRENSSTWYAKDNSSIDRNLFYDNGGYNYTYGGSFQYVEPIGKNWAVQGFVSSYYKVRTSNSDAFNQDHSVNDYYTSKSENHYISNYGRILGQYDKGETNLQFGGIVRWVNNENYSRSYGIDTRTGKDDWTLAFSPFLKFNTSVKGNSAYAGYDFDSERPSAASIIPSFNILDPTRITAGNIYLHPSMKHRYWLNGYGRFKKIRMSWALYFSGYITQDARVSAIWFDENGIRYSIPVNARKPSTSHSLNLNLNKTLTKNGKLSAVLFGGVNYSREVNYQSKGVLSGIDMENMDYKSFMSSFWGNSSGDRFYSGESGFIESLTDGLAYNVSFGLEFADILDQARPVSHIVRENYVQDSFTNVLGRNIVFSISWNFGKMNAARSNSAQRAMANLMMQ